MSFPVKVRGTRIVDGVAHFVTAGGGWSADPAEALEVVLEGDPTVRQQAAAERAMTAFLGGFREQAELAAAVRDLYSAVAQECDEEAGPGIPDDEREAARDEVFRRLNSPLKDAFLRARASVQRAEWVGRWNACFLRGPESWRKLDGVVAGDAAIDALQAAYDEAVVDFRAGKALSSGR